MGSATPTGSATLTLVAAQDFTNTPVPTAVPGASDATDAPLGNDNGAVAVTPTPEADITLLPTRDGVIRSAPTFTPFGAGGTSGIVRDAGGVVFRQGEGFVAGDGSPVQGGAFSYDVGPEGQTAAYYQAQDQLQINGVVLTTSPASVYGLGVDKTVTRMVWSPNGALLAFIITGTDPNNQDRGVWVYDVGTGAARHLLRANESHVPVDLQWSPNSGALLITLASENPPGTTHTILDMTADVNTPNYTVHTYSQGSWAPDTGSVVFSGRNTDGSIVLGRVVLPNQNYVPITVSVPGVVFTYCAAEPFAGQIVFLGSPAETGPFLLYRTSSSGGTASAVSNIAISGNIVSCEWDASRSNLLLVVATDVERQAYVISRNGNVRNVTPPGGVRGEVRFE